MAHFVRYANFDLTTGSNDGASETNAWQAWADMLSGVNSILGTGDTVKLWIKKTSTPLAWTTSTAQAFNVNSSHGGSFIEIEGYGSTIGDGEYFEIVVDNFKYFYLTGDNMTVKRLKIDGNYAGDLLRTTANLVTECWIKNIDGRTIGVTDAAAINNIFESPADFVVRLSRGVFVGNTVKQTGSGGGVSVYTAYRQNIICDNLIYSTSGGSIGIDIEGQTTMSDMLIIKNTIHNFGKGIAWDIVRDWNASYFEDIVGNLYSDCTVGFENSDATKAAQIRLFYNAYFNCTTKYIHGAIEDHFHKTLSVSPFVDAANENFSLNDEQNGGALVKGAFPFAAGQIPGNINIGVN